MNFKHSNFTRAQRKALGRLTTEWQTPFQLHATIKTLNKLVLMGEAVSMTHEGVTEFRSANTPAAITEEHRKGARRLASEISNWTEWETFVSIITGILAQELANRERAARVEEAKWWRGLPGCDGPDCDRRIAELEKP